MKNITRVAAIVAILAVQILAIGWLIYRYERVVSDGTECRFQCQGYDPHDPFRGRFVRLVVRVDCEQATKENYNSSDMAWCRIDPTGGTNSLSRIVEITNAPTDEGVWVKLPSESIQTEYVLRWQDKQDEESYQDFDKRREEAGTRLFVSLPNQFFMNENLAPEADKLIRGNTHTPIAVFKVHQGEMVLVNVEIDGKPIAEYLKGQ